MILDYTKENLDLDTSYYLKEFLSVDHAPAIRLLKITDQVHRYKFIGSMEENAIDYFLQNYIYDNLKNYKINEKLPYKYN